MSSTNTPEITGVVKRLEIIKNAISLQDTDDISYHASKLQKLITPGLEWHSEVQQILELINTKAFGEAMQKITEWIQRHNSILKWTDPEVQGLQTEIKELTGQISTLETELTDLEKTIHEFEVKHTEVLGEIILKLLDIRKKLAAKLAKENPQDTNAQNQYKEAETEEQQYKGAYEDTKKNPIRTLSPDEEQELKTLFRKISKLTHPDCVDKKFEKQASALFIKAKEAKNNNDLETLKQIHDYLVNGTPFTLKQETINEKQALKQEVQNLRKVIEQLIEKINATKNAEAWQTISKIDDWDGYFNGIRTKLKAELESLEKN